MKYVLAITFALSFLSGCITKRTSVNTRTGKTEEKYIIHRPIKKFIENVESE